jgi:hypothetical protein
MRIRQPREASDGARIRRLAASDKIELLSVCDEKLRKHEIWRQDVLCVLRTCSVVHSGRCCGEWQRTVKGFDRDEGEIVLVITVDYEDRQIAVVDGWRK